VGLARIRVRTRVKLSAFLANAPMCRATHEPNLRRLSRTANMLREGRPAGMLRIPTGAAQNANGLWLAICWADISNTWLGHVEFESDMPSPRRSSVSVS